jgi:uncharacterized protein DUF4417
MPTDNEWGVPALSLSGQPDAFVAPLVQWGSVPRTAKHGGTWSFYVDDYRFSAASVSQIATSNPAACVEPNYSVFDWTTRAEALYSILRKRRAAWELHLVGIPTWVDLCMPENVLDIALLGVPKGWRAYATRAFANRVQDVAREYERAANHAGCEPMFLVYGGGRKAAELCLTLPGAMHVPSRGISS